MRLILKNQNPKEVVTNLGQNGKDNHMWAVHLEYENEDGVTKSRLEWHHEDDFTYPHFGMSGFMDRMVNELSELPVAKRARYKETYGLSDYDIGVLTDIGSNVKIGEIRLFDYFEKVVEFCGDAKLSANWVMGSVSAKLKELNISIHHFKVSPEWIGELINDINCGIISNNLAKQVFEKVCEDNIAPSEAIYKYDMIVKIDNSDMEKLIDDMLIKDAKLVEEYKAGKKSIFGHFVGGVMKLTKGKANPKLVTELLKSKIGE